MFKLNNYAIGIWLILLAALIAGCTQKKIDPSGGERAPASSQETKPSVEIPRITDETPLPTSVLGTLPSVQEVLDSMVKAYKSADSYYDVAYVRTYMDFNGKVTDQQAPYMLSWEKPNKLKFVSKSCEICADGERISVYIPTISGAALQVPCPKELTLESLLFDPAIVQALSMSQVGSFSYLPLQWINLLAQDPLKTITFSQTEIRMLAPADLYGNKCYRLRIERQDGTAILWIDQQNGLLRRAQLPPQKLLQNLEGQKPMECSLTIEFRQAQLNQKFPPTTFRMNIPQDARVIDKYTTPQAFLLGKPMASVSLNPLEGKGTVTNQDWNGKVVVLNYWATWNRGSEMSINALANIQKTFQSNPNVIFWAVSTDEVGVSDQAVRDAIAQWGAKLPLARDKSQNQAAALGFNTIPATVVIGPTGLIEYVQIGFDPMLEKSLSEGIAALLAGESISGKTLVALEQDQRHFLDQIHEWVDQGIFVDQDVIFQAKIPQTNVAPASKTTTFHLKPLWSVSELQFPGGLLADPQETVWALENGKKVVQLTSEGKIAARYDLSLDSREVCSFIRCFAGQDGKIYYLAFAPGQQRIHVYDEQWKLRFHYPPDALDHPHEGVYDARFGDLSGDKTPEIYIGCLGTQGVQCIDMDGKLIWNNRSAGTVFMVAPYHRENEKRLMCVSASGAISVISNEGKSLAQFALPDQALAAIYAQDLDDSGTDQLCGLSVYNFSAQRLFGFDYQGKLQWSYDLPQGMQKRPVDYILTGKLLKTEPKFWITLGPDGSVHFINSEGLLIDRFNHGAFIYGLTIAQWANGPVLLLSDDKGVSAFQITE